MIKRTSGDGQWQSWEQGYKTAQGSILGNSQNPDTSKEFTGIHVKSEKTKVPQQKNYHHGKMILIEASGTVI